MESRSEEQLRFALRRARAGTGAAAKWGMTMLEAWNAIDDAITELVALRSHVAEWVCRRCSLSWQTEGVCSCGQRLIALGILRTELLMAEAERLQARVDFLEEVTKAGLSLEDS